MTTSKLMEANDMANDNLTEALEVLGMLDDWAAVEAYVGEPTEVELVESEDEWADIWATADAIGERVEAYDAD